MFLELGNKERENMIPGGEKKNKKHETCPTCHTFYSIKEVEAKKTTGLRVQTWGIRVAAASGICEACYQKIGSQGWRWGGGRCKSVSILCSSSRVEMCIHKARSVRLSQE